MILAIIVLLIIWVISMCNGLVKSKIIADNSWSDIRVFLKKHYEKNWFLVLWTLG